MTYLVEVDVPKVHDEPVVLALVDKVVDLLGAHPIHPISGRRPLRFLPERRNHGDPNGFGESRVTPAHPDDCVVL